MRTVDFEALEMGNVREIGDYQTQEGKIVKPELIYRGVTTNFISSQNDLEKFKSLNIKYIVDLRSAVEANKRPDLQLENVESVRVCGMVHKGVEIDFSPDNFAFLKDDLEKMGENVIHPMLYLYRSFPYDNKAIKTVFDMLLEEKTPIYIHCTAGKDRTGLMIALILLALGCDEKLVKQDYMYTNIARKAFVDKKLKEAQNEQEKEHIQRVFTVNEILYDETFNELKRRYPNIVDYFKKEVGLTEVQLTKLKDLYLK